MSLDTDRSDELREMYADETDDPLAEMSNGAWLDTQEFPPLEYAVSGIIPEGFGLLVSPPKAGKSWLVCGIGLACAIGGLALGRIHVDKRPVLYLALEDGQRRLQSRCRRIMYGQPIPAIHFVTKAKPGHVIPMITEFLQRYSDGMPRASMNSGPTSLATSLNLSLSLTAGRWTSWAKSLVRPCPARSKTCRTTLG
jgi:AAA domain